MYLDIFFFFFFFRLRLTRGEDNWAFMMSEHQFHLYGKIPGRMKITHINLVDSLGIHPETLYVLVPSTNY